MHRAAAGIPSLLGPPHAAVRLFCSFHYSLPTTSNRNYPFLSRSSNIFQLIFSSSVSSPIAFNLISLPKLKIKLCLITVKELKLCLILDILLGSRMRKQFSTILLTVIFNYLRLKLVKGVGILQGRSLQSFSWRNSPLSRSGHSLKRLFCVFESSLQSFLWRNYPLSHLGHSLKRLCCAFESSWLGNDNYFFFTGILLSLSLIHI